MLPDIPESFSKMNAFRLSDLRHGLAYVVTPQNTGYTKQAHVKLMEPFSCGSPTEGNHLFTPKPLSFGVNSWM